MAAMAAMAEKKIIQQRFGLNNKIEKYDAAS
jgi:hypothetical protein